MLIFTIILGALLATAIIQVLILDRRNSNQARTIEDLGREVTARGKDIGSLLIQQNKHRALLRIGECDRIGLLEENAQLGSLLIYEKNRERVYGERVAEFHAVMNDGGLRTIFRMLKAGGLDPRKALQKFEAEDGPFTADPTEKRALADLKPVPYKPIRVGTGSPYDLSARRREFPRARR